MLIEDAAYGSRWRPVSPGAKACFALAGGLAAFAAATPGRALAVAVSMALATLLGAGTPLPLYLRVLQPATVFLALSSLSLLVTLGDDGYGGFAWQFATDAGPRITELAARSLAALAALLFLVLSTPLPDLIGLLHRLRVPDVLLDLMVLCYRVLAVFSVVLHDTLTAQRARLGHAAAHRRLHSLGLLVANLAAQVWERSAALNQAAQARNGDGPLRFLPRVYPGASRELALALIAGSLLVFAASR